METALEKAIQLFLKGERERRGFLDKIPDSQCPDREKNFREEGRGVAAQVIEVILERHLAPGGLSEADQREFLRGFEAGFDAFLLSLHTELSELFRQEFVRHREPDTQPGTASTLAD